MAANLKYSNGATVEDTEGQKEIEKWYNSILITKIHLNNVGR